MSFALRDISVRHATGRHLHSGDALQHVDLSIAQGEQVAVIGPSGAGKTTLLHTLACAHRSVSGELTVLGSDAWSLSHAARHALRARLFLAPQTPPLPPRQRVVTAVLAGRLPQWRFWRAISSLIKPYDADAAFEALSRFKLQDKLYTRVDHLSGGERQRCGLARLLMSQAEALLVDEPLSALDPSLSLLTLTTLQQEASNRNATLVCSLHQVDMALSHFPRVVGLRAGRLVFDDHSSAITPAMITALYHNAEQHEVGDADVPLVQPATNTRF